MNPFLRDLVIRLVVRPRQPDCVDSELSPFVIAKGFRELRLDVWNMTKDVFQIGLGVFSAAFGLESFLLPSNFIDGGATGVALMVSQLTGLSLPVLLGLINIPFVYLAYRI